MDEFILRQDVFNIYSTIVPV